MTGITPLFVPLLNVNEDEVELAQWHIAHGDHVSKGQEVCSIESSKAVVVIEAQNDGVLFHLADEGSMVKENASIGVIGPSLENIEKWLKSNDQSQNAQKVVLNDTAEIKATPKAQKLADQYDIPLKKIVSQGVKGTIKETDVRKYLAGAQDMRTGKTDSSGKETLWQIAQFLEPYIAEEAELTRHEKGMRKTLQYSRDNALMTTIEMEFNLTSLLSRMKEVSQERGILLSLLPVVIKALGTALMKYPRFMMFVMGEKMYKYRELDIAFVKDRGEGELFTPVIRRVDSLKIDDVAKECMSLGMRVQTGRIKPADLQGACFTISHLTSKQITSFVALLNAYQTGILAMTGTRDGIVIENEEIRVEQMANLTLTYDHSVVDGAYAAAFLSCIIEEARKAL